MKWPPAASDDLGGQSEYAYCTSNASLGGVYETKFFCKINGLGLKVEQTDRQTDSFQLYIGTSGVPEPVVRLTGQVTGQVKSVSRGEGGRCPAW